MTSGENNFSNQTAGMPGNEPPAYYNSILEEPVWDISIETHSGQAWNDCPPVYESIEDIPIWSINISQINTPPNDQLLNFPLPLPEYSVAPSNLYQNCATTPVPSDSLFIKKYRQGKPIVVGVLLIFCAFVQVAVGTMLAFNDMRSHSETLIYGIPYWTSVCYIITGCLLIAAKATTTRYRVKTSLVFDILSMLLSSMGLIFNARDVNKLCMLYGNPGCNSRIRLNAFDINYILISANIVLLCLCASATVIGSYVLWCLPRETTPPEVMENYFILPTAPPEFHQTPPQLPLPPPYVPGGTYKEDEDDETPH